MKNRNEKIIIYITLFFSFAQATLRFTSSGMTTFYRILSPLIFVYVFCRIFYRLRKVSLAFLGILLYSIMVSFLFYGKIELEIYVFLFYIAIELVLIYYLYIIDDNFINNFFKFLDIVFYSIIVICLLQKVIGFEMPYTSMSDKDSVNAFFWNENEICTAIGCMGIIYLYRLCFLSKLIDIPKIIIILLITYINDAKLSLIGLILVIMIFILRAIFVRMKSRSFFYIIIIFFSLFIVYLIVFDPTIKFRDYSIDINSLLFSSIRDIIEGKRINSVGSISDRTDAIVIGVIELKRSYFLGIGLGNTVNMLQKPEFILTTAKSMHNIVFEFLTEFGIIAIFTYFYVIKKCYQNVTTYKSYNYSFLKFVFPIGFIFISSQSSIGIFSNYFVWAVLFFIILLPKKLNKESVDDGQYNQSSVQC